jgi:hypothetical protein
MFFLKYLVLLFFPLTLSALLPLIESKTIENNLVRFHLSREFSQKYVNEEFYVSYPKEVDVPNLPSSIVEAPLISYTIAIIWFSGEEYTIDEMDEDLYYSLKKVKEFFKRYFCNTSWNGELKPKRLVKNILSKKGSRPGMLYTAGLDSTTTLCRHFDENPVLISFNDPNEIAADFAKNNNFDFYTIYVNHEQFLKRNYLNSLSCDIDDWLWDTSLGLGWIEIATPFLYAMGLPTFYIGSDNHWRANTFPDGKVMHRACCPLIDENVSPMGLQVKHDPFDMTRVDKVKYISAFCRNRHLPKPKLTVCWQQKIPGQATLNCHQCEKCFRTMLNIVATGEDPRDYGFTLSPKELFPRFRSFITNFKMKTRVIYTLFRDIQEHIKKNIRKLPNDYRPFYKWFISLDLWKMVEEAPRPNRPTPFNWEDYRDLYPEMPPNASLS